MLTKLVYTTILLLNGVQENQVVDTCTGIRRVSKVVNSAQFYSGYKAATANEYTEFLHRKCNILNCNEKFSRSTSEHKSFTTFNECENSEKSYNLAAGKYSSNADFVRFAPGVALFHPVYTCREFEKSYCPDINNFLDDESLFESTPQQNLLVSDFKRMKHQLNGCNKIPKTCV